MLARTATTAIFLTATLTACASTPEPNRPAPTNSAPTLSKAEITEQCVDAVAVMLSERPADFDPETDSDPKPAECNAVPEDEYLDAYMDGISQANREGIADLEQQIEDAAEQ
ncbi:hypothetical protein [Streptomyces anulatus]|uniref:hypothetical protein n=1 Tax=Streptomyces anulatus TaxID=1892 RepID=UPI0036AB4516